MKTYKDADLKEFEEVIHRAKLLWANAARAKYQEIGDVGSCILGDGIVISYLGPRKRKPINKMLIPSREVACAQGSSHYEATKDVALKYLRDEGLECSYKWGWMD